MALRRTSRVNDSPLYEHDEEEYATLRFNVRMMRRPRRSNDANPSSTTSFETATQAVELCFHGGFVPRPSQPISLHFTDYDGPVTRYDVPPALPQPDPPSTWIVEHHRPVRLYPDDTNESSSSSSSSSSSGEHECAPSDRDGDHGDRNSGHSSGHSRRDALSAWICSPLACVLAVAVFTGLSLISVIFHRGPHMPLRTSSCPDAKQPRPSLTHSTSDCNWTTYETAPVSLLFDVEEYFLLWISIPALILGIPPAPPQMISPTSPTSPTVLQATTVFARPHPGVRPLHDHGNEHDHGPAASFSFPSLVTEDLAYEKAYADVKPLTDLHTSVSALCGIIYNAMSDAERPGHGRGMAQSHDHDHDHDHDSSSFTYGADAVDKLCKAIGQALSIASLRWSYVTGDAVYYMGSAPATSVRRLRANIDRVAASMSVVDTGGAEGRAEGNNAEQLNGDDHLHCPCSPADPWFFDLSLGSCNNKTQVCTRGPVGRHILGEHPCLRLGACMGQQQQWLLGCREGLTIDLPPSISNILGALERAVETGSAGDTLEEEVGFLRGLCSAYGNDQHIQPHQGRQYQNIRGLPHPACSFLLTAQHTDPVGLFESWARAWWAARRLENRSLHETLLYSRPEVVDDFLEPTYLELARLLTTAGALIDELSAVAREVPDDLIVSSGRSLEAFLHTYEQREVKEWQEVLQRRGQQDHEQQEQPKGSRSLSYFRALVHRIEALRSGQLAQQEITVVSAVAGLVALHDRSTAIRHAVHQLRDPEAWWERLEGQGHHVEPKTRRRRMLDPEIMAHMVAGLQRTLEVKEEWYTEWMNAIGAAKDRLWMKRYSDRPEEGWGRSSGRHKNG